MSSHFWSCATVGRPDGTVRVLTEARLQASLRKEDVALWSMPPGVLWHRAHRGDVRLLWAGQRVRLRFDMMPISWSFR